MHRDDGLGTRRYQILDQIRIEVPGDVFGINRNRNGVLAIGSERRRDIGGRAHEHLVTTPDPGRCDRQLQSRRSARYCNTVFTTCECGEILFKLRNCDAKRARNLAAAQGGNNGLDFVFPDVRLVDQHFVTSRH